MEIRFASIFKSSVHQLVVMNPNTPSIFFGEYNQRKTWSHEQAFEEFQKIWLLSMKEKFVEALEERKNLDCKSASDFLSKYEVRYLKEDRERRSFKVRDFPFIIQFLDTNAGVIEVDQIWYAHSHDPKDLVCVDFKSPEEKQRFHEMARRAGYTSGKELLTEYVTQFMGKNG